MRSLKAINFSIEFLHGVINTIKEPIFVKDQNHTWILLNEAFANLIGAPASVLIGKSDNDFLPAGEVKVFWDNDDLVFKTGIPNVNEEPLTSVNGELRQLVTTKSLFHDENGSPYLVGIIHDVTHLKKCEHLILERNRNLEQFAHLLSHDFKEPIRTILGYSNLIQDKLKTNKLDEQFLSNELNPILSEISQAARYLNELERGLLKLSTLKLTPSTFEEVDLNDIINQALGILSESINEKQAFISFKNLPTVRGDRSLLTQSFINLISNSIRYTKKGVNPEISIAAKVKASVCSISIRDNGIGIAPENLEKIFLPFVRLNNERTGENMGLGLSIVKRIIELHQGFIRVESEENTFTKFIIELPVSS